VVLTTCNKLKEINMIYLIEGAGIATGGTTEGSEFESRYDLEFSLLYVVQTGSGVHPTSYPMGTGGYFPGDKATGA
jgi:hypothetical protein